MKYSLVLLLFLPPLFAQAQSSEWRITKPQWTKYDKQSFGEFITRLGEAVEARQCTTVDGCLKSSAKR